MSRGSRLAQAQAAGRLPSIVAATFDRDGFTWRERCGEAGPHDQQYRIGSITKTITATLVWQAFEAGQVDLEDRLGTHLPGAPYGDRTLSSLLAHTGGVQSEPSGLWWERSGRGGSAELWAADDGSGAIGPPDHSFHYSNLSYALLGAMVARLAGEDWWRLAQQRVLAPLQMTDTTWHPRADAACGQSVVHHTGEVRAEAPADTGAMGPAGQLWSTVNDLARWGRFLCSGHPDVLTTESLELMAEPRTDDYSLGLAHLDWADGGAGSGTLVGHTGSMPGFQAALFVDRHLGEGVVFLTNATTGVRSAELARELFLAASAAGEARSPAIETWRPTHQMPSGARSLTGLWFWGQSAYDVRWNMGALEFHDLARTKLAERFVLQGDTWVGIEGYHRGETMRLSDGRLEVATFVYARTPYDGT